jgi:hypothetical protein
LPFLSLQIIDLQNRCSGGNLVAQILKREYNYLSFLKWQKENDYEKEYNNGKKHREGFNISAGKDLSNPTGTHA